MQGGPVCASEGLREEWKVLGGRGCEEEVGQDEGRPRAREESRAGGPVLGGAA